VNKKNKGALLGVAAVVAVWWYRTRVKTDNVLTEPRAANTGTFVGTGGGATALAPVYAVGYPVFEYNHVKISIANAGTFVVQIKKTDGTIIENATITAPSSSIWLSKVLPQDGATYNLTVNGVTTLVTAPNEPQTDSEYTDINLQD
jgi:hypothetical protein